MSHEHLPPPCRVRILWITRESLWQLLGLLCGSDVFVRPRLVNVPADAVCEGVHFDFSRDAFGFKFTHPSFPVHHPGEYIEWAEPLKVDYLTAPVMPRKASDGSGAMVAEKIEQAWREVPSEIPQDWLLKDTGLASLAVPPSENPFYRP